MEETAEKWATKHYETRNELQNYDQLGTPSMITTFQYLGLSWGESSLNVKAFSGLTFPPASSTTEPHVDRRPELPSQVLAEVRVTYYSGPCGSTRPSGVWPTPGTRGGPQGQRGGRGGRAGRPLAIERSGLAGGGCGR